MPRYSPAVLDSLNTTRDAQPISSEAGPVTHESLIRMENLIQLESDRLKANRDDLIKLQKLADAAEQTTIDSVDMTLQGKPYILSFPRH